MGMFDSFYFKRGVLPDDKAPEGEEFQTKSLECNLDRYYVDSSGHVIKKHYWDGEETATNHNVTCNAYIYSYEFLYDNEEDLLNRKYLGSKVQEYSIQIVNNQVVRVEKVHESGYNGP